MPRWSGTKKFPKTSVVNEGFLGTFNISFSEPEQLATFNSFLKFTKPLVYTKIQPCIRTEDFLTKIVKKIDLYKYLGLFEMADTSGCINLPNKTHLEKSAIFTIESLWDFLIEKLNLNPDKLYIKYFAGGNIKKVTSGKYKINKIVPPDKISIKKWQELGLKKENLLPDKSRDTFLALYLRRPTYWGYRQEILYDIGKGKNNLLDIATIEYNLWAPVIKNDKIINIKEWDCVFSISAIGVERILMIKNQFKNIMECDHIKPLYDKILKDANNKNKKEVHIATEALRVIHRILTDCKSYENLSFNRKKKIRKYFFYLKQSLDKLEIPITEKNISRYLKLNAKLQKYYLELKQGVKTTTKDFLGYIKRIPK